MSRLSDKEFDTEAYNKARRDLFVLTRNKNQSSEYEFIPIGKKSKPLNKDPFNLHPEKQEKREKLEADKRVSK